MKKSEALLKISTSVWGKKIPTDAVALANFIIEEALKVGMVPPQTLKSQTMQLYGTTVQTDKVVNDWDSEDHQRSGAV